MLLNTLVDEYSVFRASGDGLLVHSGFAKAKLSGVKLDQPSRGWTVGTNGAVNERTATIFYHPGKSSVTSVTGRWEGLQVGDIICVLTDDDAPPEDRFVVKRVTTHTFRGRFHHQEIVLS